MGGPLVSHRDWRVKVAPHTSGTPPRAEEIALTDATRVQHALTLACTITNGFSDFVRVVRRICRRSKRKAAAGELARVAEMQNFAPWKPRLVLLD
jgi:hypothetical protein